MNDFNPVYLVLDPDSPAGPAPIRTPGLVVLFGHGNRIWVKARVPSGWLRPIGRIETVVPEAPDSETALLDALLAFWPERFRSCPSLGAVEAKLGRTDFLDFDEHPERIPAEWTALRREARAIYEELVVVRVDGALLAPFKA